MTHAREHVRAAFLSGVAEVESAFVWLKVEQTPAEASANAAHE